MKTGNMLLIGGTLAAILFRKQLGLLVNKGAEKLEESAKSYLGKKIDFAPKGLPRISVDFKRAAVKLNGSIELINRTPLTATLDRYKINLRLESPAKSIEIGSTPIEYPAKEVQANSRQAINYTFLIQLDAIAQLIRDKSLQNAKLVFYVSNIKISSFEAPNIKFDITSTWNDIIRAVNNPLSTITNLLKS